LIRGSHLFQMLDPAFDFRPAAVAEIGDDSFGASDGGRVPIGRDRDMQEKDTDFQSVKDGFTTSEGVAVWMLQTSIPWKMSVL
jgi:hypothetical protein